MVCARPLGTVLHAHTHTHTLQVLRVILNNLRSAAVLCVSGLCLRGCLYIVISVFVYSDGSVCVCEVN